jgi:cellulase/cellobiase CelA1
MTRRYALLAASAAVALVTTGLVAVTLPASAATTGCSVTYAVQSQWPGGFTGSVSITNLGSALSSWTLTFDFPNANQKLNGTPTGTYGEGYKAHLLSVTP